MTVASTGEERHNRKGRTGLERNNSERSNPEQRRHQSGERISTDDSERPDDDHGCNGDERTGHMRTEVIRVVSAEGLRQDPLATEGEHVSTGRIVQS